ncbi:unnamed protein product [Discula destructiva]
MTDRFARTDLSTTAGCVTSQGVYCGGTWAGLLSKLDYIQGMGFTAIWISPLTEQLSGNSADGESYHGYWQQDINAVNSAFGSASDLIALSAALHSRGMYLMLDVVTNHYAYLGTGANVDYSIFVPFNSKSYFHPFELCDYDNESTNITAIQVCWEGDNTVSLPDLRTEDADVASVWNSWIADIVSTYGIDGIRLDSALEVNTDFFPAFEDAAGVYMIGEAFNGDPSLIIPYQQYMSGLMNYPAYYWITQAFQSTSGSISNLVNGINTMKADAIDTTLYGSFLENHDNPRFPSLTSDLALAKSAIAFTMLADGIPIIWQGQEQHYSGGDTPNQREAVWLAGYSTSAALYTWIATLNAIRTLAIAQDATWVTYQSFVVYSDTHTVAMRKGNAGSQIVGVFSNVGASGSTTVTLSAANTGFTAGQSVMDVMSCAAFTTDSSGGLSASISAGVPRVFYPTTALSGTSLCSDSTGTGTGTGTTCTTSSVAVTFNELVTTTYGQTVKISGNIAALGSWATANAVALSAAQYTTSNPVWSVTLSSLAAPGTVIEYKYIVVGSSGTVTWEADPNHTLTVPCATATAVSSSWQS